MHILDGNLSGHGAVVDVQIGWSRSGITTLRRSLRPIPPAEDARALIDSGAEVTCIVPSLVQKLGLSFEGTALRNVPMAGGLGLAAQYRINLTAVQPPGSSMPDLVVYDLLILELDLGIPYYQVLIGRDVLDRCQFLYDGIAKTFRLTY